MKKGFMFYDDEIANSSGDISQVAYILFDTDNSMESARVMQYIKPKGGFDTWNLNHIPITPKMVEDAPSFSEFCTQTKFLNLLEDYTFVAHNAQGADLHHIKKTLALYGLDMPEVEYIDTMMLSLTKLQIGALKKACEHYGINLAKHHDAMSDALACMNLFNAIVANYGKQEPITWLPGKKTSAKKAGEMRSYDSNSLGFVNGSNETIEHVLDRFAKKGIRKHPQTVGDLDGVRVVVTGTVPNYPGRAIENALKAMGARTSSAISGKTELLVIGDNAGQKKIDPALERNIPVITVLELLELMNP